MTTKTNGAEFKRFYTDEAYWPQDSGNTYHEDETVLVNGGEHDDYETVPDDALVTVDGGIVLGPQWDGNEPSFEAYFKRWRKLQSTISMVVEVDRAKEDSLLAAIKAAGGKIVK